MMIRSLTVYRQSSRPPRTWRNHTDVRADKRSLGLHEGTEEVLVGADNRSDAAAWGFDCPLTRIRCRTFHLHALLKASATFCFFGQL